MENIHDMFCDQIQSWLSLIENLLEKRQILACIEAKGKLEVYIRGFNLNHSPPLIKIYLWLLERQIHGGKERKFFCPLVHSLPKWSRWRELSRFKASIQELPLGPPHRCRVPRLWSVLYLDYTFPGNK